MSNFDLTLSPSQIEFVLKPGITLIQAYTLTNNSDSSITLNTQVLPWIPSGNDGSVNYNQAVDNPNIEFSLTNSDLRIGVPFTLAPKAQQQVVLKIKTDTNIPLADNYYTFFIFQNQEISKSDTNFSQATGKIGSHILLSVSNTENPTIQSSIENISITPKFKDVFFGHINFSGLIKNNSDFFFKTAGKITITKNDQVVKSFDIDQSNVLNHHSRTISCQNTTCQLNPPLWPGLYQLKVELDPTLNAKTYQTSFYILPISPLLLILFLIGLILFLKKFSQKNTGNQ